MVRVPGGTFTMGTDAGMPFEGPAHRVTVGPFYLDRHEVTNSQFAAFVGATGYRSDAEKIGNAVVFVPTAEEQKPGKPPPWWKLKAGADWRHPRGPGSSIQGKESYPVVQVSHADAEAYARWAGKRLPTEAEWEFAARGGLEGRAYAWGDDLEPGGTYRANYWQGTFPLADAGRDRFRDLAPVGAYPPNGYGLYDMAGNVWEWVADPFDAAYYQRSPAVDPPGPDGPNADNEYVIRGGSYLCASNYCAGYRVAARQMDAGDSATNNTGFRCAR
jgi:sulfatase modifying factor 1